MIFYMHFLKYIYILNSQRSVLLNEYDYLAIVTRVVQFIKDFFFHLNSCFCFILCFLNIFIILVFYKMVLQHPFFEARFFGKWLSLKDIGIKCVTIINSFLFFFWTFHLNLRLDRFALRLLLNLFTFLLFLLFIYIIRS